MPRFAAFSSVLALAAALSFAQAQDQPGHNPPAPNSQSNAMGATKDTVAKGVGMMSAEMTSSAKGFAQAAAMSDMYEIAAGKIASHRARSGGVRHFAQTMIHDHGQSTEKLKRAIAEGNVGVAPPDQFDDRHQGMIDDLRAAKDRDFDRRYLDQQVGAHEEARVLLRGYAKSGDNPALRRFAGEILPKVQMHLAMARTLQNEHR
ncbi:MAG: DUF4142 domain-containing protein [Alphaproteobacteria bacterium]|nr:DUF4142 domain-containing protein [Alphaproteobacteria bacterium]